MGAEASNIIIIIILVVVISLAIRSSIPHFKGEGGCCGGGGSGKKIRPKKLGRVVAVWQVGIDGMMCENCEKRIHNALNSIDGINAKVQRSRNRAILKTDREIDEELVRTAVSELGYTVSDIRISRGK